jgi:hypothetical protein
VFVVLGEVPRAKAEEQEVLLYVASAANVSVKAGVLLSDSLKTIATSSAAEKSGFLAIGLSLIALDLSGSWAGSCLSHDCGL